MDKEEVDTKDRKSSTSSSGTPEKCAICLTSPENKALMDGCLHTFCFSCLKEWSKVKAECPLCKTAFGRIKYNVKEDGDFDTFEIPKPAAPRHHDDFDYFQRYMHWEHETSQVVDRWMSSRIHEWRERIQLEQENTRAAMVASTNVDIIRRRRKYYREGIQVSHVNNNKQVREISSSFFRNNPPQVHRLAPWLKRELIVLFGANNMMLVNRVCDLILSAVSTLGILSADFYDEIKTYLLNRTDHFLKEFISFASSPHDISTYDSNACYKTRGRDRPRNNRSWISDNEYLTPPHNLFPSYRRRSNYPEAPPLAHVRNRITLERRANKRWPDPLRSSPPEEVVVISSSPETERLSSSASQSSDEEAVEFVKYIKPPHLRTPDAVIDLDSSDCDLPGPSVPRESAKRWSSGEDSDVQVTVKSVVVPIYKNQPSSPGGLPSTSKMLTEPKFSPSRLRPSHSGERSREKSSSHDSDRNHSVSSRSPHDSHRDPENKAKSFHSSNGRHSSSDTCSSSPNSGRKRRFHKVFERKRSHNAALSRSFHRHSKSYFSPSSSDEDYATPFLPPTKRSTQRFSRKRDTHSNDIMKK